MIPLSDKDQALKEISAAYAGHAKTLYRHCRFRKFCNEDSEEIVQDVFMKVWEYLQKGNKIDNIRVFLYQVTNNLIVDRVRKYKNKMKRETSLDELCEKGFEVGKDNTGTMQKKMEVQRILKALKKIDQSDYNLLVMRYIDGLMPADIAEITGITVNSVSVRLHRALKQASTAGVKI